MTGLVLKLGPRERIMINGVVMENGDRRARLNVITRNANVLRLRDAIHPEEATTPVKRVCYIAQLALAGEAEPGEASQQLLDGIAQLSHVFVDRTSREQLEEARTAVEEERFYQAMKALKGEGGASTKLSGALEKAGSMAPQDADEWLASFMAMAETWPTCIVVSDMTIPGAPMVYVNPEFCNVTEYERDEAVGRN